MIYCESSVAQWTSDEDWNIVACPAIADRQVEMLSLRADDKRITIHVRYMCEACVRWSMRFYRTVVGSVDIETGVLKEAVMSVTCTINGQDIGFPVRRRGGLWIAPLGRSETLGGEENPASPARVIR